MNQIELIKQDINYHKFTLIYDSIAVIFNESYLII